VAKKDELGPNEISTLSTAMANSRSLSLPFMDALVSAASPQLQSFSPVQLVHLARACSKLGYNDTGLFTSEGAL